MPDYVGWFVLVIVLIVAEVVTGTFYLLMVAIGIAFGGMAALANLSLEVQLLVAAIVGFIAVAALRRSRFGRRGRKVDPASNPSVILDIGQTVHVSAWQDGNARVAYRGSEWDAVPETESDAQAGTLVIKAIRGSTLVLGRAHS